jgi:hypothetical protein
MGKYNRHGNAKKENDFIVLERDIKYSKDVPPQAAEWFKQEFSRHWPSFRSHQ